MMMKANLSTKDLILLSSLLDDELDPRTKARVEARLQAEPALRDAYDSLRRTKAVLRRAPARRVPHNFTLPASMARSKPVRAHRVVPGLLWSSAAIAIVSALFVVGTLFTSQLAGYQKAAAPSNDTVTMQAQLAAPAAQPTEQPQIVYWNGSPASSATGMGGGGGAGGDGNPPSFLIYPTQAPSVSEEAPAATPASKFGLATGAATPTPESTTPPSAERALEGNGPILGVAPTQQQGEILPETNQQYIPVIAADQATRGSQAATLPLLAWIGIGLFALAVGLFIAAVLLRRKAPR